MTSFNYYNFTMFAALFYVYLITIMNYGHSLNYCVFVNAVMHVGLWNGGLLLHICEFANYKTSKYQIDCITQSKMFPNQATTGRLEHRRQFIHV